MKRKFLSVVLVAAMALSLAACGEKDINETKGSVTSASVEASVETSTEASVEESATASVETSTEASTEVAAEEGEEFSIGTVESDVYENEFFNIKVTAADGFAFADSATIAAIGQATAESFANSDSNMAKLTADAINSGATITDFYLADEDFVTTMNLTISAGKGLKPSDTDAVLDATMPALEEAFSAQGLLNVKCVRSTTTFCGEEVSCIYTTCEVPISETETVETFVKQVELIKDGYAACITANTYFEDSTDDLFAMVSKLN